MANVKLIDLDDESERRQLLGERVVPASRNRSSADTAAGSDDDVDTSTSEKEKGNRCFSSGLYGKAVEHWISGLRTLDYILSKEIEEEDKLEEFRTMKKTLHLNLAIGYLRVGRGMDCVKHCDKALELEPGNTKALYRKAQGWSRLSEYGEAAAALNRLIEVDPRNAAALQLLRDIKIDMRRHAVKEKKMNKALFQRLEHDERSVGRTVGWRQRMWCRARHFQALCSKSLGLLTTTIYLLCYSCKRRLRRSTSVFESKAE